MSENTKESQDNATDKAWPEWRVTIRQTAADWWRIDVYRGDDLRRRWSARSPGGVQAILGCRLAELLAPDPLVGAAEAYIARVAAAAWVHGAHAPACPMRDEPGEILLRVPSETIAGATELSRAPAIDGERCACLDSRDPPEGTPP